MGKGLPKIRFQTVEQARQELGKLHLGLSRDRFEKHLRRLADKSVGDAREFLLKTRVVTLDQVSNRKTPTDRQMAQRLEERAEAKWNNFFETNGEKLSDAQRHQNIPKIHGFLLELNKFAVTPTYQFYMANHWFSLVKDYLGLKKLFVDFEHGVNPQVTRLALDAVIRGVECAENIDYLELAVDIMEAGKKAGLKIVTPTQQWLQTPQGKKAIDCLVGAENPKTRDIKKKIGLAQNAFDILTHNSGLPRLREEYKLFAGWWYRVGLIFAKSLNLVHTVRARRCFEEAMDCAKNAHDARRVEQIKQAGLRNLIFFK